MAPSDHSIVTQLLLHHVGHGPNVVSDHERHVQYRSQTGPTDKKEILKPQTEWSDAGNNRWNITTSKVCDDSNHGRHNAQLCMVL